jgi:alcohol dehydrogenase
MPQDSFSLYAPTRVLFGPGQLAHLHEQTMPGKTAMLVISNGRSTRANGYLDRTVHELARAGVKTVLFDRVGANPTKEVVEEGAALARKCQVDFVVALGGGSVMDAAKVMALLAPQPSGDLWDYATGSTGRHLPLERPELPWVAITTTAGTGSEVDAIGVVSKLDTHEKIGIGSPNNFARIAVVDPELMLSVPPKFTAYQGFDALFHNMEGYISTKTNMFGPDGAAGGDQEHRRVAARGRARRLEPRGAHARCVRQHHGRLLHGGLVQLLAALHGARHERRSTRAPARRWPHHAESGVLWLLGERHVCDDRLVAMARALGRPDATRPEELPRALHDLQVACGVDGLRMSDYGFAGTHEEALLLARTARETMARLFAADPAPTTDEDIASIYMKSFR